MKKIAIVLDSIPNYRIPFFEQLYSVGRSSEIDYIVYTSKFNEQDKQLNFPTGHVPGWAITYPRKIYWHTNLEVLDDSDLVIIEQALHNPILAWRLIFRRSENRLVAFWGHGGYWTKKNPRLQEEILWRLISKVDAFFAYSEEGAILLVEHGFPLDRISVLRNSIDTTKIYSEIAKISPESHRQWMKKNELNSTNLGCFIGDYKKEKHLDFLFQAISLIRRQVSDFQMIFFGDQSLMERVAQERKTKSWIKLGGVADEVEKAQISLAKPILINPGRVGLIAVDSIAMATPIVTRILDYTHAPEIDFLSPPHSICMTRPDLQSFVNGAIHLLKKPEEKEKMSQSLVSQQQKYGIEQMVLRFHNHVLKII